MSKRLLLIEDHHDVAEMLQLYFEQHGYEVFHADTGLTGIDLATSYFPNLILLDVMLPDMDGYDTCIELRKRSLTKYIPIIFLTQRDERANKIKGLGLGADGYVTKPFDIDELRLRVQGAIERATRDNLHEARTGLPTGSLVDEEIQRHQGKGARRIDFTIDGFAIYTDVYSFMAANEVLNHAGSTIQKILAEHGTQDDFVGILDNDFVVITHTSDSEMVEQKIKDQFAEEVKAFYKFVDMERGGVLVDEEIHPIMSMHAIQEVII